MRRTKKNLGKPVRPFLPQIPGVHETVHAKSAEFMHRRQKRPPPSSPLLVFSRVPPRDTRVRSENHGRCDIFPVRGTVLFLRRGIGFMCNACAVIHPSSREYILLIAGEDCATRSSSRVEATTMIPRKWRRGAQRGEEPLDCRS